MKVRRLTYSALMLSLALIIYVVENALPLLPALPFFRVGFSNIVIIFTVFWLGRRDAWAIMILRNLLGALFSGNPSMLIYSLCGGALSLGFISLVYPLVPGKISLIGMSVVSSLLHNFGQLGAFALVTGSTTVFGLFPYLAVLAVVSGALTGVISALIIRFFPYDAEI